MLYFVKRQPRPEHHDPVAAATALLLFRYAHHANQVVDAINHHLDERLMRHAQDRTEQPQ